MAQGKPSSLSSKLRPGGRQLLYAQPVHRATTFKPSGDPDRDPPEVPKIGWFEAIGLALDLDTPEGRDRVDTLTAGPNRDRVLRENQFWEKRRFKQVKSLRAKKRELQREARKDRG